MSNPTRSSSKKSNITLNQAEIVYDKFMNKNLDTTISNANIDIGFTDTERFRFAAAYKMVLEQNNNAIVTSTMLSEIFSCLGITMHDNDLHYILASSGTDPNMQYDKILEATNLWMKETCDQNEADLTAVFSMLLPEGALLGNTFPTALEGSHIDTNARITGDAVYNMLSSLQNYNSNSSGSTDVTTDKDVIGFIDEVSSRKDFNIDYGDFKGMVYNSTARGGR